ncbi:hypothetical protein HPB51_022617 [Rhipicephalus microplus]|uniref:Uncharacterized protein n=1 Tax=Rhipicephalus microplus TaxID=6941 RepID=A0A9J6EV73_RHIMP|nr:hypothetical protein HPB51_022617 [Rhipicephalus microplus]
MSPRKLWHRTSNTSFGPKSLRPFRRCISNHQSLRLSRTPPSLLGLRNSVCRMLNLPRHPMSCLQPRLLCRCSETTQEQAETSLCRIYCRNVKVDEFFVATESDALAALKKADALFLCTGCGIEPIKTDLPRPRKRLLELMVQTSEKKPTSQPRSWELRFLRSPLRFLADSSTGRVSSVEMAVNRLEKTESGIKAVATGETEMIPCQMVLKSIGYTSEAVDPTIPYDSKRGYLPNSHGRVDSLPGVYCSGWLKTGPVGVLVATMNSSFETGQAIVKDAESGLLPADDREGSVAILKLLKSKGVRPVTFDEWLKIEAHEKAEGERKGKPSEKLLSVKEMLNVAFS